MADIESKWDTQTEKVKDYFAHSEFTESLSVPCLKSKPEIADLSRLVIAHSDGNEHGAL